MELRQYGRVLAGHALLIVVSVAACMGVAAYLAWTRTPIYEASSQLFVSNGVPSNLNETYVGSLFTQQRVVSYAQLVSSPPVVGKVIQQLHLPYSVRELQRKIDASVPAGTVLIDLSVRDMSPRRARVVADALATQFASFVRTLETPEGAQTSPVKVTVTDPAQLPTGPISPRKPLYLTLGLLVGLMLGLAGAVVGEAIGRRVRTDEDAEAAAAAPVIGSVAAGTRGHRLVVLDAPASSRAEEYRRLRTNLESLGDKRGLGSFVVSSAEPSVGKTTIVANLAIAFAQGGYRVIVVDGNLRRPGLGQVLGSASTVGLTDVIGGHVALDEALKSVDVGNPLEVLTSGPPPSNSTELLDSPAFAIFLRQLKERADLVIVDGPTILPTVDVAILARLTDGVLVVAQLGSTRVGELGYATRAVRAADAQVLGVVVNRTRPQLIRRPSVNPPRIRALIGERGAGTPTSLPVPEPSTEEAAGRIATPDVRSPR